VEPARSTLYRTFLLVSVAVWILLAALFRLPAFAALAAATTLFLAAAARRARGPLENVSVRRELYPSAFENEEVEVHLVLESARPARMVEIADRFGPALVAEQRMLEPGPLGPGRRRRLRYHGFCSRLWGTYTIGPLSVVTSDAWGLFSASRIAGEVQDFAVYPHVHEIPSFAALGARPTLAPSEASASRSGQGAPTLGVRDYRAGDEFRRIHWPASARRGVLMSKVNEVDLTPYTSVFVDLERRHRAGTGRKSTLEYLVRSAASAVWTSIRAGGFVQVAGEGAATLHVPPGRGEAHATRAMDELLRAAQDGRAPFPEVVLDRLVQVPTGSTVLLISGTSCLDLGPWGEILEGLRSRGCGAHVYLVNNYSFPPISGWPPPRAEVLERTRESQFYLRSRGAWVQVLEDEEDLGTALREGDGR
jgi:uncharacterized protein (DUF58 family)